MKISCLSENLVKGLNLTSRIVSSHPSLPVLANILLETSKGFLKISSTNLEIGLICKIGAKIEEEGSITILARLFTEYINSLPPGKVNLTLEKNNLHITSGKSEAVICGIPSSEFPLIPKIEKPSLISLNSNTLFEGLALVVFAAALDESRPVLSGVFMNFKDNELKLVATDSYRLSEKIIKLKNKLKEEKKVIVPYRSAQEILRLLAESKGEVEITLDENQILFRLDDIELTSRLIEGNFPAYEQIIPSSSETKVDLAFEEFTSTIKTASLFARESLNNIKLEIRAKGELEISATSSQVGEMKTTLEAKVKGPDAEIAFNAKYLLDVLGALKKDEVSLEVSGKLNPGVIRSKDSPDFLHIIMPLKI